MSGCLLPSIFLEYNLLKPKVQVSSQARHASNSLKKTSGKEKGRCHKNGYRPLKLRIFYLMSCMTGPGGILFACTYVPQMRLFSRNYPHYLAASSTCRCLYLLVRFQIPSHSSYPSIRVFTRAK